MVVHHGLRPVLQFTDRPSRSSLTISRTRNFGCMHGDLRPWFTGRKSLYGPSTRSYLTISSAGRKLKPCMAVYDLLVYGPYTSLRSVLALYDHWAVAILQLPIFLRLLILITHVHAHALLTLYLILT